MDHYLAYHRPPNHHALFGGGGFPMNHSFHSQLGSLYLGFPILCSNPFRNSIHFFDKAPVITSFRFFLWPVGHVASLSNTVMIRFRLQPTAWLTLITLSRAVLRRREDRPVRTSVLRAKVNSALSIPIAFSLHSLNGAADPLFCLLVGPWE